ncbi:MAG: hypothetical protein LBB11_02660 [Puniceicoccales bacterium]|jgi:hypothetical protein|nr:hypothetical protein [Puniceicoccales bacterium]
MDTNSYYIDTQAAEIFSNKVVTCVASSDDIAKQFENLTKGERNAIIRAFEEHADLLETNDGHGRIDFYIPETRKSTEISYSYICTEESIQYKISALKITVIPQ